MWLARGMCGLLDGWEACYKDVWLARGMGGLLKMGVKVSLLDDGKLSW